MRIRAAALSVVVVASGALVTSLVIEQPPAAAPSGNSSAVIVWNDIAQRSAIQVAKQYQTQSMIYISFVQAAVYDAAVTIGGRYQPYMLELAPRRGASLDAAVATAAHGVLVHFFPEQQAALDADYTRAMAAVPEGPGRDAGVDVGREAAAGIILNREGDGLEADIGFVMPPSGPGVWQLPSDQTPQTPWVSELRPFLLRRPDQFRPGPPPELDTSAWAAGFNEVQRHGGSHSRHRTAEKTDVARFWSTNAIAQYNAAFKQLALEQELDAVEAARLFAMGNLIGSDALIACFDAKYHYLFWRPQYAVSQGDTDGTGKTAAEPGWTPLLPTPNHPEYPAAHGCLTSAEAEVLTAFLDTDRIDLDLTSTAPDVVARTRHYERTTDLVREVVNARIWGGVHYRSSGVIGVALGRKVADWTLDRYFLPVR